MALYLELAFEVRLDPEAGGLSGRRLLLDVIAVQMDVVGGVGPHDDDDGVALLRPDLGRAAGDLAPANADARDLRLRRSGRLCFRLARLGGIRLRGLFDCAIVPTGTCDD